jgi:histidine kinase
VTARRHGGEAIVQVADSGIGIPPDELPLVFDRFYRVAGSARSTRGSGIGLTIARGIARAHHGDVLAASPGVGTGSTFTLVLPAADAPDATAG